MTRNGPKQTLYASSGLELSTLNISFPDFTFDFSKMLYTNRYRNSPLEQSTVWSLPLGPPSLWSP